MTNKKRRSKKIYKKIILKNKKRNKGDGKDFHYFSLTNQK